jgi:hypothetical protein
LTCRQWASRRQLVVLFYVEEDPDSLAALFSLCRWDVMVDLFFYREPEEVKDEDETPEAFQPAPEAPNAFGAMQPSEWDGAAAPAGDWDPSQGAAPVAAGQWTDASAGGWDAASAPGMPAAPMDYSAAAPTMDTFGAQY